MYSLSSDSIAIINQNQHSYFVNWCKDKEELTNGINNALVEVSNQNVTLSMLNKKGKAVRDLSEEVGSFLFFQICLNAMRNMPKGDDAKKI